jgi:hypothetical protein
MRALIEAGAEVHSPADDGVTALQECFIHPPSRTRSEAAKRSCFQQLAAAGADLNAVVPSKQYTGEQEAVHSLAILKLDMGQGGWARGCMLCRHIVGPPLRKACH